MYVANIQHLSTGVKNQKQEEKNIKNNNVVEINRANTQMTHIHVQNWKKSFTYVP